MTSEDGNKLANSVSDACYAAVLHMICKIPEDGDEVNSAAYVISGAIGGIIRVLAELNPNQGPDELTRVVHDCASKLAPQYFPTQH